MRRRLVGSRATGDYTALADDAPSGFNPQEPGYGADYTVGQTC